MKKTKNPIVKSHFTKVPNRIIEASDLKPAEKLIAIYILSFETCFASLDFIAKRLGYSRSTVQRAMAQLEYKGVVEKVRGGGFTRYYVVQSVQNWYTKQPEIE